MEKFLRIFVATCLLGAAAMVQADTPASRPELREAVAEGRIVPLSQLLDWLDARYRGQVIEVELEVKDGELVYEIDLLGPQGQRVEFLFDATTGELSGIRGVNLRELER